VYAWRYPPLSTRYRLDRLLRELDSRLREEDDDGRELDERLLDEPEEDELDDLLTLLLDDDVVRDDLLGADGVARLLELEERRETLELLERELDGAREDDGGDGVPVLLLELEERRETLELLDREERVGAEDEREGVEDEDRDGALTALREGLLELLDRELDGGDGVRAGDGVRVVVEALGERVTLDEDELRVVRLGVLVYGLESLEVACDSMLGARTACGVGSVCDGIREVVRVPVRVVRLLEELVLRSRVGRSVLMVGRVPVRVESLFRVVRD